MRWYRIGDKLLPSVSSVLDLLHKPGLEEWYGRLGAQEAGRRRKEAMALGLAIHRRLEAYNKFGESVGVPPSYINWFQSNVVKPVLVEEVAYSLKYGYAGRVDLVAYLQNSRLALIDFKTVARWGCHPKFLLQTGAYAMALQESWGLNIAERWILQIHRNTDELAPLVLDRGEEDFVAWLKLLEYFHWWYAKFGVSTKEPTEIVEVPLGKSQFTQEAQNDTS